MTAKFNIAIIHLPVASAIYYKVITINLHSLFQVLRFLQLFSHKHPELHALPLSIQEHLGLKPEVHLFGSVDGHLQVTTEPCISFPTTWRPLSAISKFLKSFLPYMGEAECYTKV